MNWKNRVSDEVKQKVNIELVKTAYAQKIEEYKRKTNAPYMAVRKARKEMIKMLKTKGLENQQAIHLLHVTEVAPYAGCGCCLHRKPKYDGYGQL